MPSENAMAPSRLSLYRRHILAVCLLLLATQLAFDLFLPQNAILLPSGILLMVETCLASLACFWRARQSDGTARLLWALIGSGESVLFSSYFAIGVEFIFVHFPHNQTAPSDFLIFLMGLPIILALGTPSESTPQRVFYWLDGVQIILLIAFTFISVFGTLPFISLHGAPVPGLNSTIAFSAELFAMAAAATLRTMSHPTNRAVRTLWPGICLFLWIHAIFDSIYNFTNLASPLPPFRLQFLLSFSSLSLIVFATTKFETKSTDARTPFQKDLALFLDNGSPVIYPALVVALAIFTAFEHLRFSLGAIAISLLAFGIRSTVLQVRFQRVQLQMEHTREKLEMLTLTDSITGIANRRNFDHQLNKAWESSKRTGKPFSVLIIDVDFFKMLNDTYGHTAGDRCLRAIAFALQSTFRDDEDMVARFGGDEFAAIMNGGNLGSAVSIARRMLRAVEALELRTHTPIGDTVTISVGVTSSAAAHAETDLLQKADTALYQAKHQGRNRVVSL